MTPDEQEALSNVYAFGVRVLQLSSGNWAHFDNTALVSILPQIDEALCKQILLEQEKAYLAEKARLRQPRIKLNSSQLLKELGL